MRNQPEMPTLQQPSYMLESNGRGADVAALQVAVLANMIQTGGGFSLFQVNAPTGFATQLHIHYAEDIAIFILEGSLTMFWGEESKEAAAGAYIFMPRGTPHGFRVKETHGTRLLYLAVPGGLERFAQERASHSSEQERLACAARFKIEVMGPLPD
jgi:quercetin dioxygenase-like cupin family protein